MSAPITIYIPRMSSFVTEAEIKTAFEYGGIGQVSRVDFIRIDQKQGFVEATTELTVKSAFVHFDYYYNFEQTTNLIRKIGNGESHKFYSSCDRGYWLLLKAKKQIQATMMNRHQIVDNCRVLEAKVEEQATQIAALQSKLENTNYVVYNLLGGLFCQRTQGLPLRDHLDILHGKMEIGSMEIGSTSDKEQKKFMEELSSKSKWTIWPTTRQGDSNEARIGALEALLFGGEKKPMRSEEIKRVTIGNNDLQVELDFGV